MSVVNAPGELAVLESILRKDWSALQGEGDEITVDDKTFKTVAVVENGESRWLGRWLTNYSAITKLPGGELVSWDYGLGKTEYQEDEGPGDHGDIIFTPIEAKTETIAVTRYVPLK